MLMWLRPSEARDARRGNLQDERGCGIFGSQRGVKISVSKLIGQPRLTNTWVTPHEQRVMLLRTASVARRVLLQLPPTSG